MSKTVKKKSEEISKESAIAFREATYEVLGEKGIEEMINTSYQGKHQILEKYYSEILKHLEKTEEGKVVSNEVIITKRSFFIDAICRGEKFYRQLTSEQKFSVLLQLYHVHSDKNDAENPENKKYRDPEVFVKALDNGEIENWSVSRTSYINKIEAVLDNEVTSSDVLFWLHTEWQDMTGDYWRKYSWDTISRSSVEFNNRHYRAFNIIFKEVFGREIKSIDKFRGSSVEGFIGKLKDNLD